MNTRQCDICGAGACQSSRDLVETEPVIGEDGGLWKTWEYESDKVHYRCKDHQRVPKETYLDGSTWGGQTLDNGQPWPIRHIGEYIAMDAAMRATGQYE